MTQERDDHPQTLDISAVQRHLRAFSADRDWEQYHTPKNLACALAVEVAELVEVFQWLTAEQSAVVMRDEKLGRAVENELADILQYVIRFADILEIDLDSALWRKLEENADRYPIEKAKGNARKYTEWS